MTKALSESMRFKSILQEVVRKVGGQPLGVAVGRRRNCIHGKFCDTIPISRHAARFSVVVRAVSVLAAAAQPVSRFWTTGMG